MTEHDDPYAHDLEIYSPERTIMNNPECFPSPFADMAMAEEEARTERLNEHQARILLAPSTLAGRAYVGALPFGDVVLLLNCHNVPVAPLAELPAGPLVAALTRSLVAAIRGEKPPPPPNPEQYDPRNYR